MVTLGYGKERDCEDKGRKRNDVRKIAGFTLKTYCEIIERQRKALNP